MRARAEENERALAVLGVAPDAICNLGHLDSQYRVQQRPDSLASAKLRSAIAADIRRLVSDHGGAVNLFAPAWPGTPTTGSSATQCSIFIEWTIARPPASSSIKTSLMRISNCAAGIGAAAAGELCPARRCRGATKRTCRGRRIHRVRRAAAAGQGQGDRAIRLAVPHSPAAAGQDDLGLLLLPGARGRAGVPLCRNGLPPARAAPACP